MKFLALIQEIDIKEKIDKAPDAAYGIGIFIGSMLPFVVLVALAYFIYRYNKNKKE
ncbi:hypothetical protein [Lacinutrix sp. WUR7]|uniref:hypothetical protein n=1 Tax=Lacinutrix sp. WUR7 TaxID=2653681 RepID=UPI00193EA238|nr:hypothetical protein [Lacinutrix sp. WUR7]